MIYCIRNSLNAKRLVHFMVNFMFLSIHSNCQWFESFPIELKVVITQGFSFISCRTVEACTPYYCLSIQVFCHLHVWIDFLYKLCAVKVTINKQFWNSPGLLNIQSPRGTVTLRFQFFHLSVLSLPEGST